MTVGKPEVVINGESRPLDVPPMIYQGNILVPVRVISEGMGAYVQWVPEQHVVVVRYIPATPPPTPAPTDGADRRRRRQRRRRPKTAYKDLFVAGDYIISPKVYNEFSPGNTGTSSFAVRGAFEFNAFNIPWMIEGSYEQYGYPHNCGIHADARRRTIRSASSRHRWRLSNARRRLSRPGYRTSTPVSACAS